MSWRSLVLCLALVSAALLAPAPATGVDPEPPDRVDRVDVYVVLDRSGSMSSEINNIKGNLANAIDSLQCPPQGSGQAATCIPDLWAGAATVGYQGSGAAAFQNWVDLQPNPSFAAVPSTEPTGSNTKEPLTFAVDAAVTGEGGSAYGLSSVPPRTSCAGSPAATSGYATYGYPCFRDGALPVVVLVTDEPPLSGPDTWASPAWSVVRARVAGRAARLVGVVGDNPMASTVEDLQQMAADTGGVDSQGAPVVVAGAGANATTALRNAILAVVDAAVPPAVVMTTPDAPFQLPATADLEWTATDGNGVGLATHDVRFRKASYDTDYADWVYPPDLQGLPADRTSATRELRPGNRYCFSVRTTDRAGHSSAWSTETCTARPLDDRALKPSTKGWQKGSGDAYYGGTFRRTTRQGATLSLAGAHASGLAVVATTCPKCGTLDVLIGRHPVGTVRLRSTTKKTQQLIELPPFAYRSGTVRLRVTSSGRPVVIDGLGVARS